jgi:hypothetical protein
MLGFLTILAILVASGSYAQVDSPPADNTYAPIRHAVPFHAKNPMFECWLASARMVAEYYWRSPVPDQCAMLQMQSSTPCCQHPSLCMRGGGINEIQALIAYFGGHSSSVTAPSDGVVLYNLLRQGPIVIHTRQGAGHFIVATGMQIVPGPTGPLGIISINDPLFGQYEIDFYRLMQTWNAALVIY